MSELKGSRPGSFFKRNGADALILLSSEAPGANFVYFSGTEFDNSAFVATREGERKLLVNRINEREAREKFGHPVIVFKDRAEFWKKLGESLAGCGSVAIDASSVSAKSYFGMKRKLRGKRLLDASAKMLGQRAVKEHGEIRLIRESARTARRIIEDLEVRAGKTELGIARELRIAAIESGAATSFEPIVLSGKNTAMPHGKPTEKKLADGEVVLVDFGIKLNGYCSDITRCFFLGECKGEKEAYGELRGVFKGIAGGLKPGVRGARVQKICDELMKNAGFGAMIHSPGHGIGLEVHEGPSLSKKSKDVLERGMTIAIEPAFYREYGLRYEDDLVIEKGGARLLV